MNKLLAAAGILATLTGAQKTPPNVPINTQIGALDFPLTCNIPGFGDKTFSGYFTATAPNFGASGQKIYYNDVAVTVTIPKSITMYAGAVKAKQASALVKFHLSLDNASPADFNPYPNGLLIQNISIDPTTTLPVHIPKTGRLGALGPVTLGAAGTPHRIHLGQVNVAVNLQDANGNFVFGPLNIACGAQPVNFNIGFVNIGPAVSGAPPINVSVGAVTTFPPITNGQDTGSFRYPYTCKFTGPLGTRSVDLTVSGTVPAFVAPNAQFFLTDADAFLRVPAAVNTAAKNAYPGLASYRFTFNSFNIKTLNASPATTNVLKTPIVITSPASGALVLALPPSGKLKIGPITAGAAGKDATLIAGQAGANVVFLDSSGKSLGSSTATCTPAHSAILIGLPITTATPNPISD